MGKSPHLISCPAQPTLLEDWWTRDNLTGKPTPEQIEFRSSTTFSLSNSPSSPSRPSSPSPLVGFRGVGNHCLFLAVLAFSSFADDARAFFFVQERDSRELRIETVRDYFLFSCSPSKEKKKNKEIVLTSEISPLFSLLFLPSADAGNHTRGHRPFVEYDLRRKMQDERNERLERRGELTKVACFVWRESREET